MTQENTLIPFHFNVSNISMPHDWRDVSMLVLTSHNGSSRNIFL
ncbi:hypothetical protein [Photorhabdus caribbeanensis]|nr:hypothetical protein [Photorhabdus caribbeanensis]